MSKEAVRRIGLQFDDNALVPLLFGEHGSHLARIEDELGVQISSKGNEVVISGTVNDLKAAQRTLDALWERLINDLPVGEDEVDAAIRIAGSGMDPSTRELAKAAFLEPQVQIKSKKKPITARSPTQAAYLEAMRTNELVFGLGPAGTGKTYLAVAQAVTMLESGEVDRLVLCRPAVEAGEHLGFLPGDMQEKVDPYLRPIYDALNDMLTGDAVLKYLSQGKIEVAPLAFMRGRTLSNAFILLDEAQNTTAVQMKMVLTRIGEGSRMVVTGDATQTDLPRHVKSGLNDALEVLTEMKGVAVVKFNESDVVRNRLVARIVQAYEWRERGRSIAHADNSEEDIPLDD